MPRKVKRAASAFLALARKPNLDQETAYAICRLIDVVGWDLKEDWDWNWLDKKPRDYRKLIDPSLLDAAWERLRQKEWLSLQNTNDRQKRISTIAPVEGMKNLRTLVLMGNVIRDLSPIKKLTRLKDLNCGIADPASLKALRNLEELSIGRNPLKSLRVLEELPRLRELTISTDQIDRFAECQRLRRLIALHIDGEDAPGDFNDWPEMPALKLLRVHGVQSLAGIDRFRTLEALRLSAARVRDLSPLARFKSLTHLSISASKPLSLDVRPLSELCALRSVSIYRANVEGLSTLDRLPVLHEVHMSETPPRNARELKALCQDLTPWDAEFKSETPSATPSLGIEVVEKDVFDHYDGKAPFGVRDGEYNGGMFVSERVWLVHQICEALALDFEDEKDFATPHIGGLRRSDRVIIYSMEAYEKFRDIALRIQRILCEMKNEWIIWCQSLLWEAPEEQEIPEGTEDFIVWIYRDRIVATEENARVVRKLIAWRNSER